MVRFDKPCINLAGAVAYFREHMKVGDYLAEEGRVEMVWQGEGAGRLGLSGVCDLEAFSRLCAGQHPATAAMLNQRDKGAARRICFFAQISAPKDVSIAHLVGGDNRIRAWWDEAVRETLREIEAVTATRVRRDGANEDRRTGNMTAAVVTHDASRALDPQLHTHVCIMNATFDATEGRWKSVQPSGFFRHQGFFREVCYNQLAKRMLAAGYELEPGRKLGFNIRGFPPELREIFSKRRNEIVRRAEAAGQSSQDALQTITAQSRDRKTKATAADLRADWHRQAGDQLATVQAVIAAADGTPRGPFSRGAGDVMLSAEAHVFERQSVVDERGLLREALATGRGQAALEALRAELEERVATGALIREGENIGSPEALAAEREFVGWAETQTRACGRLGNMPDVPELKRDQSLAAAEVLESPSRLVTLQGNAGTGKTTSLRAIVAGIERAGGRVFGCAPSAGAADLLRKELTPEADTLQQWLANESLQKSTRGRVVVVDEAGLISVRQMRDLCRLAAANDNRLLLVGDIKQHASVEAGDALRCLQKYARVPVVHLLQIRRQRDPAYREAVALLASGDARGAFDQFARLGAVREIRDEAKLHRAAAEDYVRTLAEGRSCLAISPVWTEIHAFTDEVRARLKEAEVVAREERVMPTVFSLQWTREQRRHAENYQPDDMLTFYRDGGIFQKNETVTVVRRENRALVVRGDDRLPRALDPRQVEGYDVGLARRIPVAVGDRLLVRANLKPYRLKNGDLVEVAGFTEDGSIALADGRTIPAGFLEFSHGYATTSHSAQGKTVDRGILIMADAGIAAGNLAQAYVSNSRFRESQMIYTTNREEAREAMQRPSERTLVSEIVPAPRRSVPVAPLGLEPARAGVAVS